MKLFIALMVLFILFGIILAWYILYIIYHGIKKIKEGFSSKRDYLLFRDFKLTFMKEKYIPLSKRKSILNQLKNQLKI